MARMRAVLIQNPGPDSKLIIGSIQRPEPGPDELLVRVHATALNRADLLQRSGTYPPPDGASPVLGLEMAGTVVSWGNMCRGWNEGDRVNGLLPGGGYAEYVVLPQDLAMPLPESMNFEKGAAIPEVFLTAYQALFWLGDVKERETVLIHAGASGVGTAAIQLVRQAGADVYVTASAPKHELCISLGATAVIDYKNETFSDRVKEITKGKGVDVILDFIGAPYLLENIDALALDGRLVMLALMGGTTVDSLNLANLFRKRIHIKASTLRNRDRAYKKNLTRAFIDTLGGYLEEGTINPVIDSVFDWSEVEAAHARMAANQNAGKIVLRVSE